MTISLAVLFRSLSQLHGAGVAWPQALETALGRRTPAGAPRDAWTGAVEALARGRPLSEAVGDLVPAIDRAGLRAAEASGRTEELLASLARRHEGLDRRRLAERGALAYPVFVAHVAALLMMVPDLVLGRTAAALGWALAILVPTHAFLLVRRRLVRADTAGGPVEGALVRLRTKAATEESDARALTAFGWLHEAGVPPLEALELAAAAGRSGRVALDLVDAGAEVRAGRPIAGALTRVPPDVRAALATGEATGRLGEACERTARTLEESAHHRREVAFARMKPITILILGLFVGIRVVSFYATAMGQAMGEVRRISR